ncbi:MAG: DUF2115 domain-containing protein [Euryarchaeota archaeon]|nr:DUF2115 domain-containing protein [Euryarchaeota archaeon]
MTKTVEDLDFSADIRKEELLDVLRKEASKVHISDIMESSAFLLEDAKYIQAEYREQFIRAYAKGFLARIKDVKDDKNEYNGYVSVNELRQSIKLLKDQKKAVIKIGSVEARFFKIYTIISIYTTFVLDEPIHPLGTPFPGGFEVKYENGTYYCPVKDKQKDNLNAVCGFCIAEQDESIL